MDEETLVAHYIVLDPLRPRPEEARLAGSNIPVWQIIQRLKVAKGDVLALAAASGLPREAVLAARSYYLQHASVIDARIRAERSGTGDSRHAA